MIEGHPCLHWKAGDGRGLVWWWNKLKDQVKGHLQVSLSTPDSGAHVLRHSQNIGLNHQLDERKVIVKGCGLKGSSHTSALPRVLSWVAHFLLLLPLLSSHWES